MTHAEPARWCKHCKHIKHPNFRFTSNIFLRLLFDNCQPNEVGRLFKPSLRSISHVFLIAVRLTQLGDVPSPLVESRHTMPGSNLAAYLAKNYLTASNSASQSDTYGASSDFQESTRPKKKRKKNKDPSSSGGGGGGLIVADDDEDLSLRGTSSRRRDNEDGDGDGDTPTFESGVKSAEFRKKKGGSGWKVVSTEASAGGEDANEDKEAADRILAEVAEETRLRRREFEDEDAPAIVENVGTDDAADLPRMSSGARAGLQTAADTAALVEREEREAEAEAARRQQKGSKSKSKSKSKRSKEDPDPEDEAVEEEEQETIYRDATGRRIDISLRRAEARAAAEEKKRAEKLAQEQAMGEVQRREKEERKQRLEDAKFLTVARGADDDEMNEHLRSVQRWDDPMARYMAERAAEEAEEENALAKRASGSGSGSGSMKAAKGAGGAQKTKRRTYQGPPPAPNRYGIAPGFRWDGVDRGNGFEKDWFQARAKQGREEELRYQWQMDE